jgi:hypothetical protein
MDPVNRAKQLASLVRTDDFVATHSALNHLASGGAAAMEVLEAMLADPSLSRRHGDIAGSLVKIDTPDIHLAQILDRETRYWTRTCPGLQPNWFNTGAANTAEAPERHWALARALVTVRKLQSEQDRDAIAAFAEVWTTCPPINAAGMDPIAAEIDRLLSSNR